MSIRACFVAVALPALVALSCGGSGSKSDGGPDAQGEVPVVDLDYVQEDAPPADIPDGVDAADAIPVDMGADVEPCFIVTSPYGFMDNCDGTVTDTRTGLRWEKSYQWTSSLDDARTNCNTSRTGGLAGWRLPSIDEMRGLILGCDATSPTGTCAVHDPKSVPTCIDETCRNDACNGCPTNQGPVVNPKKPTQHCYMDGTFEWQCSVIFWSNTQVKAKTTGDKRSWYVTFYDAGVNVPPSMAQIGDWATRCVWGQ